MECIIHLTEIHMCLNPFSWPFSSSTKITIFTIIFHVSRAHPSIVIELKCVCVHVFVWWTASACKRKGLSGILPPEWWNCLLFSYLHIASLIRIVHAFRKLINACAYVNIRWNWKPNDPTRGKPDDNRPYTIL